MGDPAAEPDPIYRAVVSLLSSQMGVAAARIGPASRLAEDLGMGGLDASEFIEQFFERFPMDARGFEFDAYFLPEAGGGGREWFVRRRPVTVRHLVDCVRAGAWLDA